MTLQPRRRFILSTLALISAHLLPSLSAAEPVVHRDLYYTAAKDKLQALDLYTPAEGSGHPIVLWIHGGGWKKGDKANLQHKPKAFTEKGYVLASINHRLLPTVTVKEMMTDLATGIRWLQDHAAEYGGDPQRIIVFGHSAGAHLAALLCTDQRYLQEQGVSPTVLKGCVPLDVSAYDIPKRIQDGGNAGITASFISVFGSEEAQQRNYSPVHHIAPDKNIPPFLIFHVASRDDTKAQAHWLESKLHAAKVAARVHAAEGKTHGSIGNDLGLTNDIPTQEIWKFLETCVKKEK